MERNERARLQAVRRALGRSIVAVDELLKTAQPPRRLSVADIRKRALAICKDIQAHGGSVSKEQLKAIVTKHGMPYTAVGALYAGGYVRAIGKRLEVGPRTLKVARAARHRT
jgi:hypothetical protein